MNVPDNITEFISASYQRKKIYEDGQYAGD